MFQSAGSTSWATNQRRRASRVAAYPAAPPDGRRTSSTGRTRYRYDLAHYVIPHIGGQRLQALRPATVSKLYSDLAASGGRRGGLIAASSVEHVHRTLRKALNDAVNIERLIASNPADRAKRPRVAPSEVVIVWNADQLHAFLATAAPHRLSAFYRLAAYTGARRGELLFLRWSDLALDVQ